MKALLLAGLSCLVACPVMIHAQPDPHAAGVDHRGEHAMGFSMETTRHHFELLPDGGIIEVNAKDGKDTATRDQIRAHFVHISSMFSANNFDIPMFIHDTVPPGVPVMKEKSSAITYTLQQTPAGARIKIHSDDPDAVKAVHEFLVFQIRDHRTGDSETVKLTSGL
jgi:TusA-related sulfurtransferase